MTSIKLSSIEVYIAKTYSGIKIASQGIFVKKNKMVYNENRENDRDHYWYPCMLPCHALALDTCSTVRVVFITRAWIYISYYHATLMYVYIQCINILRNEIYGIECCLCTCRYTNYQIKYWKCLCTRTHTQCKKIYNM